MSSKMLLMTQAMKDFMKNLGGYVVSRGGFTPLPYTYDPLYYEPSVADFDQVAYLREADALWRAEVEIFRGVTLHGWPK